MPNHICPACDVEFYHKKTQQKFCSRKCWLKTTGLDDFHICKQYYPYVAKPIKGNVKMSEKKIMTTIQEILNGSIFFKKAEKIKSMLIDYPNSPTGRAYVGFNKKPFMPNDNGIGFKGVLLQDENRSFVLNCETGTWHRKITEGLLAKSGLTTEEYKIKYGLSLTTGLVSDTTSYKTTKAALKNKHRHVMTKAQKKKGSRRGVKKQKKIERSVESQNKFATCELQLKTRTYEFMRANREFPTQGNRGNSIYKAVRCRYGTWGEGLMRMGLPFFRRQGTNMTYIFPKGEVYKFNINQMHDREELYHLVERECITPFFKAQFVHT